MIMVQRNVFTSLSRLMLHVVLMLVTFSVPSLFSPYLWAHTHRTAQATRLSTVNNNRSDSTELPTAHSTWTDSASFSSPGWAWLAASPGWRGSRWYRDSPATSLLTTSSWHVSAPTTRLSHSSGSSSCSSSKRRDKRWEFCIYCCWIICIPPADWWYSHKLC